MKGRDREERETGMKAKKPLYRKCIGLKGNGRRVNSALMDLSFQSCRPKAFCFANSIDTLFAILFGFLTETPVWNNVSDHI